MGADGKVRTNSPMDLFMDKFMLANQPLILCEH